MFDIKIIKIEIKSLIIIKRVINLKIIDFDDIKINILLLKVFENYIFNIKFKNISV